MRRLSAVLLFGLFCLSFAMSPVSPQAAPQIVKSGQGADTADVGPRTGIAFVMDTTKSMQPYINQCRAFFKTFFDHAEKTQTADRMAFAFVAFRNSTAAVPKMEYVSEVVSDFVTARNRSQLESRLAKVKAAKVPAHSFNNDSLAGVRKAIESLSWEDYDSRIILLVTDAGPLPADDRYRSVSMEPQELNDFASQKGIWIVTAHIQTPAGKKNFEYARKAYQALSMKNGRPQYQVIQARTPKEGVRQFAVMTKALARSMGQMINMTDGGKLRTEPVPSSLKGE